MSWMGAVVPSVEQVAEEQRPRRMRDRIEPVLGGHGG